jgi:hypothetical protein
MWLIDTETLSLVHVDNPEGYKYATLSHTWGTDEVSFQDIADISRARWKAGFSKIKMTCKMARKRGIAYAWIDTCCIDKSSSAELSEAINSMFRLYRESVICFTYLADLSSSPGIPDGTDSNHWAFAQCRWFTRGWTLQELIAPESIEFYDEAWKLVGNKAELCDLLADVTRISKDVLRGTESLQTIPVGVRMAWAANRETTRVEDRAYCLLGIFDINMPMLYGEGSKAFIRLEQEVAKETNDMSLFAWQQQSHTGMTAKGASTQIFRGIFAESPDEFSKCDKINKDYGSPFQFSGAFTMTNNGLFIETPLGSGSQEDFILNLCCSRKNEHGNSEWIGIRLVKTPNGYVRSSATELFVIPSIAYFCGESTSCYIKKLVSKDESREIEGQYHAAFSFNYRKPVEGVVNLIDRQPTRFWDIQKNLCITHGFHQFIGYQHFSFQLGNGRSQVQCEFVLLFGILDAPPDKIEPWITIYSHRDAKFKAVMENLNPGGNPSPGDLLSAAQVIFPNFVQSGRTPQQLALSSACQVPLQISKDEKNTLMVVISSSECMKYNCSVYEVSISFELV